ncbi:hypothetical protein BJ742DRAFT_870586, partial [Cladochytrium replicatum]
MGNPLSLAHMSQLAAALLALRSSSVLRMSSEKELRRPGTGEPAYHQGVELRSPTPPPPLPKGAESGQVSSSADGGGRVGINGRNDNHDDAGCDRSRKENSQEQNGTSQEIRQNILMVSEFYLREEKLTMKEPHQSPQQIKGHFIWRSIHSSLRCNQLSIPTNILRSPRTTRRTSSLQPTRRPQLIRSSVICPKVYNWRIHVADDPPCSVIFGRKP